MNEFEFLKCVESLSVYDLTCLLNSEEPFLSKGINYQRVYFYLNDLDDDELDTCISFINDVIEFLTNQPICRQKSFSVDDLIEIYDRHVKTNRKWGFDE